MEEKLDNKQSLEIISTMIAEAKHSISRSGSFYILLWGWVISLANFAHYTLEKMDYDYPFIVWVITIPTAIVNAVYSVREARKAKVKVYLDKVYGQIWVAIGIAIIIALVFMGQLDMHHNPVIMLLAGVGMYVTGILLKFNPVKIGAFVLWAGAIIGFLLPVVDQFLVAGISIFLGYLIPGYMLKRIEK